MPISLVRRSASSSIASISATRSSAVPFPPPAGPPPRCGWRSAASAGRGRRREGSPSWPHPPAVPPRPRRRARPPAPARRRHRAGAASGVAIRLRSASVQFDGARRRRARRSESSVGSRRTDLALPRPVARRWHSRRSSPRPAVSRPRGDCRPTMVIGPAEQRGRGIGEHHRLALPRGGLLGAQLGLGGPLAETLPARRPTTSAASSSTPSATTLSESRDRQLVEGLDEEEVEGQDAEYGGGERGDLAATDRDGQNCDQIDAAEPGRRGDRVEDGHQRRWRDPPRRGSRESWRRCGRSRAANAFDFISIPV